MKKYLLALCQVINKSAGKFILGSSISCEQNYLSSVFTRPAQFIKTIERY